MNDRLPPGQKTSKVFPVLDLGVQPEIDLKKWKLMIEGEVEKPCKLSLEELKQLGVRTYTKDFHCVTHWSKYDVVWSGIPFVKFLDYVKPRKTWRYLIQYGKDGYSTNVRREDVEQDDVFLAFALDGKPIPQEHGVIRMIIPRLYGWKGSKFLMKLEFSKVDQPGYWEQRGYHARGRAWKEERYG